MSMHTPNSFRDLSMIPIPRAQRLAAKKAALPASPGQTPGGYQPSGNSGSEAEHREEIRSYRIGRRALDSGQIASDFFYGHFFHDTRFPRLRVEHQQFVGSDKSNFGMQKGGKLFDDTANLDKYAYDTPEYGQTRYNAEIIDQAREELNREWEKRKPTSKLMRQRGGIAPSDPDSLRYHLIMNNCQDYVASVLERAERIAQKKGVNLILKDEPDRNTPSGKNARTSKQLSQEIDPGKILYPDMR